MQVIDLIEFASADGAEFEILDGEDGDEL